MYNWKGNDSIYKNDEHCSTVETCV